MASLYDALVKAGVRGDAAAEATIHYGQTVEDLAAKAKQYRAASSKAGDISHQYAVSADNYLGLVRAGRTLPGLRLDPDGLVRGVADELVPILYPGTKPYVPPYVPPPKAPEPVRTVAASVADVAPTLTSVPSRRTLPGPAKAGIGAGIATLLALILRRR